MKNNSRALSWAQYRAMLDKSVLMYELYTTLPTTMGQIEWKHRWAMIQLRILQAMTNPIIFHREVEAEGESGN